MQALRMTRTHPDVRDNISDSLIRCIDDCYACAQICTACADACLAESDSDRLKQCIRLNLDCADICGISGTMASRHTGSNPQVLSLVLDACRTACRICAEECSKHAGHHKHCRICAETCRQCEESCDAVLAEMESQMAAA